MKILITGVTGALGQEVSSELYNLGHEIVAVSRSEVKVQQRLKFSNKFIAKDLSKEPLSADDFNGVDAVIHLMGESIDGRWTDQKKKLILSSRVQSSLNLLKNMPDSVRIVISGSAQGIYGDRFDAKIDESAQIGTGFLAEVCELWEEPFRKLNKQQGRRSIQLRTGIVLDPQNGALKKMLPIFKLNLGAAFGDGKQYMSWIASEDMTRIVLHILNTETLSGAVNCSTTTPVQNSEFTKILCKSLGTLQLPNIPDFILKILFGEMSSILTNSTRVYPRKLVESGFKFKHADLSQYLKSVIAD